MATFKHLQHRNGGKITAITAVAHETYRGVASWHFVGDVDWGDGKPSSSIQLAPFVVCYDQDNPEAKAEGDGVHAKMAEYLLRSGRWHEPKNKRDGRVYSWTPKLPAGQEVLSADCRGPAADDLG